MPVGLEPQHGEVDIGVGGVRVIARLAAWPEPAWKDPALSGKVERFVGDLLDRRGVLDAPVEILVREGRQAVRADQEQAAQGDMLAARQFTQTAQLAGPQDGSPGAGPGSRRAARRCAARC